MKIYGIEQFTFTAGSAIVIDDITDMSIDQEADERVRGSDGDKWASVAYFENFRLRGQINSTNMALLQAGLAPGVAGYAVMKFPQHVSAGAGYESGSTKLQATIASSGNKTMVIGAIRSRAAHMGQDSQVTIPWVAVSADGVTSPVAFALAA